MGDFNVNLINYNKNRGTYEFLEQLLNHNFTLQIKLPTRIIEKTATLIDNIFVNGRAQKYNSGNIITSISDHLPQFCNNYRPISLLSNISKLIEKLMHKRLQSFLEQQNCFYNARFGFRLSLSTNNALMSITENTQSQLDQNKLCAGVFFDLKKTFDAMDHEILLKKLSHYGIREIANEWCCSYLTKRK